MRKSRHEKLIRAALATCFCYLLAHGSRFFQNMFSGDALVLVYQNDYSFEIALGRCFNPLWVFFRGALLAPWLISFLAMAWIALAVYFVTEILEINGKLPVFLTAAAMTMNLVLTCLNTAFLPWVDLYSLAMFLNVLAVWFFKKSAGKKEKRKWYDIPAGALCIALALGTYQAYITVAVALVMFMLLTELSDNGELASEGRKLLCSVAGVLLGGGIYVVIWKTIQKTLNIWTSDGYNGLAGLWDYSGTSFWELIRITFRKVFDYFWNRGMFVSLYFRGQSLSVLWVSVFRILNLLAVLSVFGLLLYRNKEAKTRGIHKVLQALLLFVLPLGINCVCFLSKGMEHTLMQYSFVLFYVYVIKLFADLSGKKKLPVLFGRLKTAAVIGFGVICWIDIVFSNQVYLRLRLQEDAAVSLMTRLVSEIEDFDGYVPGETPVAFVGTFMSSPDIIEPDGFRDVTMYMMGSTIMEYPSSVEPMLKYYLNANIALCAVDPTRKEIQAMPAYPMKGSIDYLDGILVVKISD